MTLQTRKPTGKPSWPIVLLAGAEKAGKSWACAEASASDLIDRTLWLPIGEDDPDEYAAIPGADFDIVIHDATLKGILAATRGAVDELKATGGTGLLVIDSATRLWMLITDMAQRMANQRAAEKAKKYRKPAPEDDVQITMDLWNWAKDQWEAFIGVVREHQGPVLITARLAVVTVLDANGKPTSQKDHKVEAHKSLPFDVSAVVQMPERGETILSGVRSVRLQLDRPTRIPAFTVDELWRKLGAHEGVDARRHTGANPDEVQPDPVTEEQLTAIATLASKLGLSREQKLSGASYYAGRPVESTRDLAKHEASRVIDALKDRVEAQVAPEPVEAELDIEEAPDEVA